MKIDLTKPFEIKLEKFSLDAAKDSVNPYMKGKILRKKYESEGYKVIQSSDFENSLLIWFIRKHKFLDKYIKVKVGEYKHNTKIEDYNKQIIEIMKEEDIEKLLFVCRICSYLGDPSFPDFIINKDKKPSLIYVHTGDEMLRNKIAFILLSSGILDIKISFSCLDFVDYKMPEKLDIDMEKTMQDILQAFAGRVDIEKSFEETGIDLRIFKNFLGEKTIDTEAIKKAHEIFMSAVSAENKIKTLLKKLQSASQPHTLEGKPKPEQLAALRASLGINMLEANDLLNLYEITKAAD